ncbi:MAG: adenosylcobinamide-GDP ribazoletransferase [Lachnospiraceae bacterium]|jgi:adenosylcobinamide-GDP ribazoletransferase|nr:adenosylcobinamide-GDP ribazoletransferase [Lachnospiraceae bacterium]
MNLVRSFFIAFSMYSKIPMPRTEWTKESMKYSMCFFPLIGAVIGGLVVLWNSLSVFLGAGTLFHSVILVLLPVLVTGGIHLDGLLDTADALSSYKPMEEKLEILKDSHAGAFAIIVGICYFLLSLGIWSEAGSKAATVLAVGFVLSRALSGLAIVRFKLAKNTGLAATFSDMAVKGRVRFVMYLYILACAAAMLALDPVLGIAGLVGALGTFMYYRYMAYKKFGGITGDLAGFFLQVCELVMAVFVVLTQMCLA